MCCLTFIAVQPFLLYIAVNSSQIVICVIHLCVADHKIQLRSTIFELLSLFMKVALNINHELKCSVSQITFISLQFWKRLDQIEYPKWDSYPGLTNTEHTIYYVYGYYVKVCKHLLNSLVKVSQMLVSNSKLNTDALQVVSNSCFVQ